jgi:hypothetical protein
VIKTFEDNPNPYLDILPDASSGNYYIRLGQIDSAALPSNLSFKVYVCYSNTGPTYCESSTGPYDASYSFTGAFNSQPFIFSDKGRKIVLTSNFVNYVPLNWYDWDQFKTATPTSWNVFASTQISMYMFIPNTVTTPAIQPYLKSSAGTFTSANLFKIDATITDISSWTKAYVSIYDGRIYASSPTGVPKYYLYNSLLLNLNIVNPSTLFSSQPSSTYENPFCFDTGVFTYQITPNPTTRSFLTIDLILYSATAQDTQSATSSTALTGYVLHYNKVPGLLAITAPLNNYQYTINFLAIDKLTEAKQSFNFVIRCYSGFKISIEMASTNVTPNVYYPIPYVGNNIGKIWVWESKVNYTINVKKNNNASVLTSADIKNVDIY